MGIKWMTQSGEISKLGGKTRSSRSATGDLDSLTGLLKKDVAEERIASLMMKKKQGGTLFLCNVDHLRSINDQHGHLAGDECLKQVAQVLTYMMRQEDILGRRGGDEFLIYMPYCRDEQRAQETCERIENRFRVGRGREKDGISFTVTVVYAMRNSGNTCKDLLKRASAELEKRKAASDMGNNREGGAGDRYVLDAKRIRRDLLEQIRITGAYCQDYETFKGIYRFLERGIIRSGQKACVILLSVVNEQGESLLPYEKDILMERLGENIRSTLRIGDVYTRYSSGQYLILVIDATEGQADMIADRIKGKFLAGSIGNDILIHRCYELQPARIREMEEWDDSELDRQSL
ncbi:MAG: GGDEF domain-containing protein [Ruminococcus flavefaciens]|nr:GGDEF domain-containing protein [Ruminococcus flavefaciens]